MTPCKLLATGMTNGEGGMQMWEGGVKDPLFFSGTRGREIQPWTGSSDQVA